MQLTAEEEMPDLVLARLPALDEIEAAFIKDCCLREPNMPLRQFSKRWRLSAKALIEVREQALVRLKDVIAKQGINSLVDIV